MSGTVTKHTIEVGLTEQVIAGAGRPFSCSQPNTCSRNLKLGFLVATSMSLTVLDRDAFHTELYRNFYIYIYI
jgi:hypothetical protein